MKSFRFAWFAVTPFVLAAAVQAEDYSKVEIQTTAVAGSVSMLAGAGGNIGVSVGDDGVLVIDDQYAPLADKIVAAIRAIDDGQIRFVINTHWHGDHTGGNEKLSATGALIVAHENVRRRMSVEQFIEAFDSRVPPSPATALPIVTFTDSLTFHLNGDEVRVVHVPPAHTDGDSMIRFLKADVLHTGDVFFNGLYPFIDVSSGGSVDGVIRAVEVALSLAGPTTKIIPGHGPLANRAALAEYHAMLAAIRGNVASLIASGNKLEAVQAGKPSAEFDEKWGKGFLSPDQFVAIVYDSLTR